MVSSVVVKGSRWVKSVTEGGSRGEAVMAEGRTYRGKMKKRSQGSVETSQMSSHYDEGRDWLASATSHRKMDRSTLSCEATKLSCSPADSPLEPFHFCFLYSKMGLGIKTRV